MPVLERVLSSLSAKSLPSDRWELIVVDNGSDPAITRGSAAGLSNLRIVVEPTAELTPAKIRASEPSTEGFRPRSTRPSQRGCDRFALTWPLTTFRTMSSRT
jgi:hypothetical protein